MNTERKFPIAAYVGAIILILLWLLPVLFFIWR